MLKNEKLKREVTRAYCGGDSSSNSFSRFGKRKRAEEAEKDNEKSKEEDSGETE